MSGKSKPWSFYPLYGLEVRQQTKGLSAPIFGDATILSYDYLHDWCREHADTRGIPLILGAKARDQMIVPDLPGASADRLIEATPDSFIAVCRKKEEESTRYARSIRAFMTATLILHARVRAGFTMTPWSLFWHLQPTRVWMGKQGLSGNRNVVANEHIVRIPISVTEEALQKSWDVGTTLDCQHEKWHIHKESLPAKILIGPAKSLNKLRLSLRDAASALAAGMESHDLRTLILVAVVSMERFFHSDGFEELRQFTRIFNQDPKQRDDVNEIIDWRNLTAHEGFGYGEPSRELANKAILWAWMFFSIAASLSQNFGTREEMIQYLRTQVRIAGISEELRSHGHDQLATELLAALAVAIRV